MHIERFAETRCKGTKRCAVAEDLFDGETIYRKQMLLENKNRDVYRINKHKIALNIDDDKRLVQADGITTLAKGYVAPLAE